jgi:phytoene/squalene synthetase
VKILDDYPMTPEDYCHTVAVQQGSDFRYSLLGLPLAQRQTLVAVHAFQIETTRIVDECRDTRRCPDQTGLVANRD